MKINRNNYEQYLIDYLDGKLDPDQEKILLSFLEFNPDLKNEFKGLENTYLVPSGHTYQQKDELLKVADPFEELCIDSIEQQLDLDEEKQLKKMIAEDSQRELTYKLYQSTILSPDLNIRYRKTSGLKKFALRKTGIRIIMPAMAAAAIVLIALLIFNPDGTVPVRQEISRIPIPESPAELANVIKPEKSIIARTSPEQGTSNEVVPVTTESATPDMREPIRIARVQPLGITKVLAVSTIPSYALLHKLREDPGRLEQLALDQVESGLLATGQLPKRARNALWRLADAGVRGLNQISEEEVELSRNIDSNGKISGFKFESSLFGISTPVPNTNIP